MPENTNEKDVKKGFWARLMDSLDKKMEAKAKSSSGCCCSGSASSKDQKCK